MECDSRTVPRRPIWWSWELELSAHLLERMVDRNFTEVGLRGDPRYHRLQRRDMKQRYLQVTYRRGRPLAAYLYLPHPPELTAFEPGGMSLD